LTLHIKISLSEPLSEKKLSLSVKNSRSKRCWSKIS